jgi:hypothetical protein
MRLMSVGSIAETQSDLFLCDALRFGSALPPRRDGRGDVLITNPLHDSVHILTVDYLFTVAPCALRPARGVLQARLPDAARASFATRPLSLVGGSPVVEVVIGEERFVCTLDTGAPGGICLGKEAAGRLMASPSAALLCSPSPPLALRQTGVNADDASLCSVILETRRATVHGVPAPSAVAVLLGETTVHHTDGYVGMGCLRAYDVLLDVDVLGLAPSGLSPRGAEAYRAMASEGGCATTPSAWTAGRAC